MLEKLFESLDEKIFTPELKSGIETEFNEAVEDKAKILADERIEEEIESLNEKAADYVEEVKSEMVKTLDEYLERTVEEFVKDSKKDLTDLVSNERCDMIIEAFENMLIAAGVEVSEINEAKDSSSVESKLDDSIAKYDSLVEENISLSNENKKLIKMGVIAEMKEDLSLVEAEKFDKLAEFVEFSKDGDFLEKLTTIKENVTGTADLNESKDADSDKEGEPVWSHLV